MTDPTTISCWADNPQIVSLARQFEGLMNLVPDPIDRRYKTEVQDREDHIQVVVICTFRVPK